MLFNSVEFIVWFLPATLLLFFQIGRFGYYRLAIAWLFAASLIFYSWWNPINLIVLIGSILFNFAIGAGLSRSPLHSSLKQAGLALGIGSNLALIGYFKYASFLAETTNAVLQTNFYLGEIILPLGISFFTFQQIAYLIDSYRGEVTSSYTLLDYCLFVAFFPQLIAGPLLHHKEIISQFTNKSIFQIQPNNFAIGLTIFAIGLFKKIVFADTVAVYANQTFATVADGELLTLIEAWIGALSYSLQLYFDFSGYSDMAIGLGKLFNLQLQINFNSPYKATSIIDFWRRWHITLSNYLRDYLYIPLGGSRKGNVRRYINLMITMVLCGLWHGAGWTFIIWGGLQGVYLLINHRWRSLQPTELETALQHPLWRHTSHWLITFVAVVVGWVIFRAPNLNIAVEMLKSMACFNGISLPESFQSDLLQTLGFQFEGWLPNLSIEIEQLDDVNEVEPAMIFTVLAIQFIVVRFLPNTQQWMNYDASISEQVSNISIFFQQQFQKTWHWQPTQFWAIVTALMTATALLNLAKVSEFLYFEF
ncbi:MBOAT family O-acyltransferase [Thermocoleostomius sinensis]|uniref:MBOAT family protein n=1 Tax=Thermocoleostomius sinensis A174 TaxID=2016057 RepID=A0A9E8ZFY4_9CYAN|nr:MBOAT family protein [Thermocoleostomius sinensis]WAL61062.1 MBOAT family protein [Thermocoleostomius sinensis A174]